MVSAGASVIRFERAKGLQKAGIASRELRGHGIGLDEVPLVSGMGLLPSYQLDTIGIKKPRARVNLLLGPELGHRLSVKSCLSTSHESMSSAEKDGYRRPEHQSIHSGNDENSVSRRRKYTFTSHGTAT